MPAVRWDNAKKIVETILKQKGTPLHDATVIGDTVGDPFKDTSSVAMNPIIKFTTLFGLLAVELAVSMTASQGPIFTDVLAGIFLLISMFFVHKSFYGMRIEETKQERRGGLFSGPPDALTFFLIRSIGQAIDSVACPLYFSPVPQPAIPGK